MITPAVPRAEAPAMTAPLLPWQIRMLPPEECPYCCQDAAPGDRLCHEHKRIGDDDARQRHVEFMEDE
jgi:hypothetical protein